MMAYQLLSRQAQSAAGWLTGRHPGRIAPADLEHWRKTQLLLPIGDAVGRQAGNFAQLLPPGGAKQYRAELRAAAAMDAGERRIIATVIATLAGASVPALLLKGAALSYTVYPDSWLRARSDIDLLVPPGRFDEVTHALAGLDLMPAREVTHPLITRQRHFHGCGRFPTVIDVHEALVNPPVLRDLPQFADLWARAQPVPALAGDVRALGTPDALLHALVHRVAHHNSSVDLLWLYDMHLLVGRMITDDWKRLVETCEQARVAQVAADGLQILVSTLGSAVPADVLGRLERARGERSAALVGGGLTEWRLQWINFKSLRGVGERLAFVRAHLLPPASALPSAAGGSRPPFRYLTRAFHGARKWRQRISQER